MLVHLVEIGGALARLPDPDGNRKRALRHGQDLGRRARALGREDEAEQVCAGFGGDRDVLLPSQSADLHERTREQLGELRTRIRRAHERRPDEDRVRARELGLRALGSRGDSGLGDHYAVAGRPRDELELGTAVDLERRRGRAR